MMTIPENEQKMIKAYIQYNADSNGNTEMASLDYILRCWKEAKGEYLSDLFGDSLIIKRDICFKEGEDDLINKVHEHLRRDSRCMRFMYAIEELYYDYRDLHWCDEEREHWQVVRDLFDDFTLARNAIYRSGRAFALNLNNGKTIKIQNNAKPMRIIAKIAESFGVGIEPREDGISDLEYFRRAHSMVLNEKELKGELCLSIHPLDYMTMSDNNSGWSSCMSWSNSGEYRMGTVEMMNSPCVVVGYLASTQNPYHITGDECWNNKKWRCLFIVDRDFIINVKGYPYRNKHLVCAAIEELTKLSGWGNVKPVLYDYYEKGIKCQEIDGHNVSLEFCTNFMYNDFAAGHYIALNPSLDHDLTGSYNFSGVTECMWCGDTRNFSEGESTIVCNDCSCESYRCECCNDRIYRDDAYYVEGDYLCEYCFNEEAGEDQVSNEWYYWDNLYNVDVIDKDTKKIIRDFHVSECTMRSRFWDYYFTHSIRENEDGCGYHIYVQDMKPEGMDQLNIPKEFRDKTMGPNQYN